MFAFLARYQKQELLLILTLVGIVAIAPLSTYVVWPAVKNFRAVSASRASLRLTTLQDGDLGGSLATMRTDLATLEQELHGDMANLPPKEIEAFIIGRLQSISWRNRIELVGVEPETGEVIESFHEMLFTVRLAGDYFDLHSWLRDLGTELGFVVIKRYQMSPTDRSARTPRLSAELTIATYRAAEQ